MEDLPDPAEAEAPVIKVNKHPSNQCSLNFNIVKHYQFVKAIINFLLVKYWNKCILFSDSEEEEAYAQEWCEHEGKVEFHR